MSVRRKGPEKQPNHERWLLTYADLITLLLIFFVVMYSVTSLNISKFHALAATLHTALGSGGPLVNTNNNTGSQGLLQKVSLTTSQKKAIKRDIQEQKMFSHLYAQLETYVHSHNLQASVAAYNLPQGIRVTIQTHVLFASGSDILRAGAQSILLGLLPFLQRIPNLTEVQGYTDSVPIHTSVFPSNWFLSVGRAAMVTQFLVQHGLNPHRVAALGFSKYHPVVSNATSSGRRENRRVDLLILHSWISPL